MHIDPTQAGVVLMLVWQAASMAMIWRTRTRAPRPIAEPAPEISLASEISQAPTAKPVERHRVVRSSIDFPTAVETWHFTCVEHDECPTIAIWERV